MTRRWVVVGFDSSARSVRPIASYDVVYFNVTDNYYPACGTESQKEAHLRYRNKLFPSRRWSLPDMAASRRATDLERWIGSDVGPSSDRPWIDGRRPHSRGNHSYCGHSDRCSCDRIVQPRWTVRVLADRWRWTSPCCSIPSPLQQCVTHDNIVISWSSDI